MLTRSTSLPIDGSIAPSREFTDTSLQEYQKRRQPLTIEEELHCATSPQTTATVGPVCFVEGFAASSTTDGSPARSTRAPVSVPRPSRILDSLVQQNPIRAHSLHRSTVAVPARPHQYASTAIEGRYSEVSFAIEPIQLPIVPLNLLSLQSLHTTAVRERGADRSANGCAAAAHRASRSVSLPSSAGSVPSRLFVPMLLSPRAVLRGTA